MFCRFYLFILCFFLLGNPFKALATLDVPEVEMGTVFCEGSMILGKIVNIPAIDGLQVVVTVNGGDENYFEMPDRFACMARSAPADTIEVFFIDGMDSSSVEIVVTVLPKGRRYDTLSICASEFPWEWEGMTILSPGNFLKALDFTTADGCDSIAMLHLSLLPEPSVTVTEAICADALPYMWNGISVSSGGSAAATFVSTGANGCDSTTTLNLIVNPVYNIVDSQQICFNDLPFSWNGFSVSSGGMGVATFNTTSVHGCDSNVTLYLKINFSSSVILNDTICQSELPYIWMGMPLDAEGEAIATFMTSSSAGCDSLTTLNLYVLPTLLETVTDTVCLSEMPYSWNGMTISSGGLSAATYTSTSYLYGCDSIATLDLYVGTFDTVTVSETICDDELPFVWNGIPVSAGGIHVASLTVPSSLGCDSLTYLNLTVNPTKLDTVVMTVCAGALPIEWNGITVASTGTAVATYSGLTSAGCDSTTVLTLLVNPPYENFDTAVVCANEFPIEFGGLEIFVAGIYTYMSTGGECDTIYHLYVQTEALPFSEVNDTTCYESLPYMWMGQEIEAFGTHIASQVIETSSGCDSLIWLNLYAHDAATAPLVVYTAADMSILLPEDGVSYQWELYNTTTEEWQIIDGATGYSHTALVSGKYRVAAYASGCPAVYSNEVDVEVINNSAPDIQLDQINVYPNPTSSILIIDHIPEAKPLQAFIYDALGRKLKEIELTETRVTIDVAALPVGVYLLEIVEIQNRNTRKTLQWIKQ